MQKIRILWTDDEIEVLKPHIIFLNEKGYEVDTCSNGLDTLDLVENNNYDLIFLDENMPGLSGIDTLKGIKELKPEIPVIMITKSEEEDIMEAAIGSKIADYLIKPVKPTQILLTIKKNIESEQLVTATTTTDYQSEFGRIRVLIDQAQTHHEWIDIYKKITYWDLQLDVADDPNLREIQKMLEQEANRAFVKFISGNYLSWIGKQSDDRPLMSPSLFTNRIIPLLRKNEKVFFIVIDNLRYDQWKIIFHEFGKLVRVIDESIYYSILPTATQYSRNAIFSGMMPSEIADNYSNLWVDDDADEGKNNHEKELLDEQLKRNSVKCKWTYNKINNNNAGKRINDNLKQMLGNDLTVLVYNFIDLLSHARTDTDVLRDIARDEAAYRSLTLSWFSHSPLLELIRLLSGQKVKIIITTDHGTVRVSNPVRIVGDKRTSSNLRYKMGRNLDYNPRELFEIKRPEDAKLPITNISSRYIFARNYDFFVYPNNYNHFVNYYRDTFQHGGISMQEILVPLITLEPV